MPHITFAEVNTTLTATETEVAQHDASIQALADARSSLTAAQDVVTTAQEAVTIATDVEGTEKADVVAGINQAIQQLTTILQTLQV